MKVKFIHTGDLHLGCKFINTSFPKEIARNRREEMWATFNEIIKSAKNEEVDFLLISGDLFEGDLISIGDLKRIQQSFESIHKTNVVISPGNHDIYDENSLYKYIEWSENVCIFKKDEICKIEYEYLQTVIYGFSWNEKYYYDDVIHNIDKLNHDKNNILIIHGDVYNKKSNYLPLDLSEIMKMKFDYVALGHIHKPDIIENNIRYCGSPEPLDFGEIGQRGIILGELNNKNLRVDFVPISKRQFIIKEVEITPSMTYQDIYDNVLSLFSNKSYLYRIILKGIIDSDIDIENLINEISNEVYHQEIINKTVLDFNLEKIMIENKDNIIGNYIKEFLKMDIEDHVVRDALYLGLRALLKERMM
ncbi:MAG: metallophosphoesterase family protein [Eubacteriaceae bacterium]